jgi:hypothetical protein
MERTPPPGGCAVLAVILGRRMRIAIAADERTGVADALAAIEAER